jgi:transcriptional regulator of acetoin/glycerol metabolism
MPLDALEKRAISKAIQVHNGNLSKVAKDLKISRQTLYNKIKKHGL